MQGKHQDPETGRLVSTDGRKGFQHTPTDGSVLSPYPIVLAEAGLSTQDAARWQRIAAFDPERLAELIAECREHGHEVTTAYLLRAWRREKKSKEPAAETLTDAVENLESLVERG